MLALEPVEALRNAYFLSNNGTALTNAYPIHAATTFVGKECYPELDEIREAITRICPVHMRDFQREADRINPRTLGVLMLGYAYGKGPIPLKKEPLLEGIKLTLREKLWEMNFRAFERGEEFVTSGWRRINKIRKPRRVFTSKFSFIRLKTPAGFRRAFSSVLRKPNHPGAVYGPDYNYHPKNIKRPSNAKVSTGE